MDGLVALLPVLACGAMMVGCALVMSRGHGGHGQHDADRAVDPGELARLREEVAQLRAEHDGRLPERP